MASWSTPAQGLKQGAGGESAFMQPSGEEPDHKASWVKNVAAQKMWCNWDATVPLD